MEQYPNFRGTIVRKIIDNFDEITSADALRVGLWMLGEYSEVADVNSGETMTGDAFEAVHALLGDPPYLLTKESTDSKSTRDEEQQRPVTTVITKNVVLPDGTYATVTSTETVGGNKDEDSVPHLRKLVTGGDILLGAVATVCLTKMALKSQGDAGIKRCQGALMTCAGVGRMAETKRAGRVGVHADCLERLTQCARILLDPEVHGKLAATFLSSCHEAFSNLVAQQKLLKVKASELEKKGRASQADDLIQFRQLRSQAVQGGIEVDLMDADDISRAIGAEGGVGSEGSRLKHVYQLTGYSDPVYAEASVTVHDYDIVLEMTIINRTPNTLTNLTVELATMGDLKLVERPQSHTIGPLDERKLRANIKVSSTETGHIFGTIVFDNSSTAQKTYVNLSDIQLDIMDYIRPAECKSEDFRSMWAEFEWENKVAVNTNITDLREFLAHVVGNTNMTCLSGVDDVSRFALSPVKFLKIFRYNTFHRIL